jgi:hypothetical protein
MKAERFASLLAAAIVFWVSVSSAWAQVQIPGDGPEEIFVSCRAGEGGDGSQAKPFATIAQAQQAVRAKVKAGLNRSIDVVLLGGTYRLTEPLVFGTADGGDGEYMVIYRSEGVDSPAIISGGVEIAGWRDAGGGVWSAKVPAALEEHGRARTTADARVPADDRPAFNELFVTGRRRTPARHPNEGYLRVAKTVDPRLSFQFNVGDIPPVKDATQLTLVFLHDWETSRVPVASVDQASRTLTAQYPVGCKGDYWRIDGFEPHPRYFVTGAQELLDAPGEWWLDRQAEGKVLYRSMAGEKLEGFVAVAPLARQLLIVRGGDAAEKLIRNLRFVGLTFEHCAWSHTGARYAGSQACFHFSGKDNDDSGGQTVTPAVEVQNARTVRFEACTFRNLGGSGVWLGYGCRDSAIAGCTVADVAGNGVMLGEPSGKSGPLGGPGQAGASGANSVRDCVIERCGVVYYGAVGLWVGLSGDNVIARNEIRYLPYTGISVGWMWNPTPTSCKGNLVANNHIHHVMQVLSDGGGIYTLGWQPGAKLTGNWIHDVLLNAGRAESNGMFIDEGSTDMLIENNLIHNVARSPLRFHKAGVNLVKANVLVCGKDVPPVRYNATPEANIKLEANLTPEAGPSGEPPAGQQAQAIRQAAGPGK